MPKDLDPNASFRIVKKRRQLIVSATVSAFFGGGFTAFALADAFFGAHVLVTAFWIPLNFAWLSVCVSNLMYLYRLENG